MLWPEVALPAMAGKSDCMASTGIGGGGVGGRRVPVVGGIGMGMPILGVCEELRPPMGG